MCAPVKLQNEDRNTKELREDLERIATEQPIETQVQHHILGTVQSLALY
jgi:hypothetical protein